MAKASTLLSEFLRSDIVRDNGPFQLAIANYELVTFDAKDGGRPEKKWALLVDDNQKLLLNKENLRTLIEAFGDEMDGWIGQRVEVFFDKSVTFGGKRVGGIRLKALPDELAA
jgi:hypothetical protein